MRTRFSPILICGAATLFAACEGESTTPVSDVSSDDVGSDDDAEDDTVDGSSDGSDGGLDDTSTTDDVLDDDVYVDDDIQALEDVPVVDDEVQGPTDIEAPDGDQDDTTDIESPDVDPVDVDPVLLVRHADTAWSGYLTFYQSEFARWRLQYRHTNFARGGDDNTIFAQGTFIIGVDRHPLQ